MQDVNMNDQNEFIIEKIKERPVNKKKLVRRTIITASMAVIFGLIACFTFLVLEPIISKWLYPEEKPQVVLFPEDDEEMSPEEMLADTMQEMQNIQNAQGEFQGGAPDSVTLEQTQIDEILSSVVLDKDNYLEIYDILSDYRVELKRSLVTVSAVTSDVDWMNNVSESSNQVSGVIIANNGIELLILAEYEPLKNAEKLSVTFYNGATTEAAVKMYDAKTDMVVLAIELAVFSEEFLEAVKIVELGTSNRYNIIGTPVIALGSPLGNIGSIGYGMIAGTDYWYGTDAGFKMLQTDIYGSRKAGGFLFNMEGQLLGIITEAKEDSDMKNLITAYGISDLRKRIEKITNGFTMAYLGVSGTDVSGKAHQEHEVPYGAYVKEVAKDSPAMLAGIQQGDIIVRMDDLLVVSFSDYAKQLLEKEVGSQVNIRLMRQSQGEYKEMNLTITLGESGKEE